MKIGELRQEIDDIDGKLLELFLRRMAVAEEIGRYKQENALPVRDLEREREVLSRLCEKAQPEMAKYAKKLFALLIEMSVDYQGVQGRVSTQAFSSGESAQETC